MKTDEMIEALRLEAKENPAGDLLLKAAANLERLMALVNDARLELFRLTEYSNAPPGESEENEKRRERSNEEHLMAWQNETRKLMLGES